MLRSISFLLIMVTLFTRFDGAVNVNKQNGYIGNNYKLNTSVTSVRNAADSYQFFSGGCHGEKMNAFVDRVEAWKHQGGSL